LKRNVPFRFELCLFLKEGRLPQVSSTVWVARWYSQHHWIIVCFSWTYNNKLFDFAKYNKMFYSLGIPKTTCFPSKMLHVLSDKKYIISTGLSELGGGTFRQKNPVLWFYPQIWLPWSFVSAVLQHHSHHHGAMFMSEWEVLVHFFSSVACVWGPGAKTTGPIAKKFGFSSI
jgi:hypothetical protein